jgi:hypothetical protein
VAREVLGQVAIEFEEEAEETVADFAFCQCAGRGRLLVEPVLQQSC